MIVLDVRIDIFKIAQIYTEYFLCQVYVKELYSMK